MNSVDLAWLAGLMEGEGSFMKGAPSRPNGIRVEVQMTDEDVIRRVAGFFGVTVVATHRHLRHPEWKPVFSTQAKGSRAAGLMKQLRPLMGNRRRHQIDEALRSYVPTNRGDNSRKLTRSDVARIRARLRRGEMMVKIARRYGVSKTLIRLIRDGKIWKGGRTVRHLVAIQAIRETGEQVQLLSLPPTDQGEHDGVSARQVLKQGHGLPPEAERGTQKA